MVPLNLPHKLSPPVRLHSTYQEPVSATGIHPAIDLPAISHCLYGTALVPHVEPSGCSLPFQAEPGWVTWAARPPGAHRGALPPGLAPGVGPGNPLLGRVRSILCPLIVGRPYQERTAPDNLVLKIPRPHKPFHHLKAPIQQGIK